MEVVRPILLVTDDSSTTYWHSKFQPDSLPFLRWHVLMDGSTTFNRSGSVLSTESLKKPSMGSLSINYCWAPEGAIIICFTSGTTGRPRGVVIRHSALIIQSLAKIAIVGYGEDDVYLHTTPLCHIGGISSAMAMLMLGGCHVLIPKFESKTALEAMKQHHVTSLITVPAIMADLIRSEEICEGLETVEKILNGGGGLSVELIKGAAKLFPRAKLLAAYGMTEACSSLTFQTLYDPASNNSGLPFRIIGDKRSGTLHQPGGVCVGKPAPHIELKISVEDSSHVGRILTRGPHVMLGYWGQISTRAFNPGDEAWLDTGDIGKMDDGGNVWLVGRTKDRIKSGGENVYPEEVESILLQHPGISGIVVVGLPDTRLMEMVVACIQLKDNWQWADLSSAHPAKNKDQCLSSEILQNFCREKNLTGFKIPKTFIIWRNPFPFTTTGKLRRDQIRRELMSHMQFLPSSL